MNSRKVNLDTYLGEALKQFIAIKDDDYKKSQEVFKGVFDQVKAAMGNKCNYFKKYSSQVLYAGSVLDGVKVSKLDEFDMDIVIKLPINYEEGIIIENDQPGYVRLKIETAFDNLDKQQDWEKCHKVTRDWRDSDKYLLQNKFRQWMHGIVQKALNDLKGQVTVKDVNYYVTYKESGPAYTLNIQNQPGNEEFKLDVDLVPVIRFMYPCWPKGYRTVEESIVKDWLIVPKPNKALPDGTAKNRAWRLSFQDFERNLMKGCQQLKTTLRLVKKLRDSLDMRAIASYYIKTLFLWKIDETKEKKYWQKGLTCMFRIMVQELHDALKEKKIRYFWHEENNLIEKLKPTLQKIYVEKLSAVLAAIDNNDVDKVLLYLLTTEEVQQLKQSDFYKKQKQLEAGSETNIPWLFSQTSRNSTQSIEPATSVESVNQSSQSVTDSPAVFKSEEKLVELVRSLHEKIESLSDTTLSAKLDILIDKVDKLDSEFKTEKQNLNEKVDMLMDKLSEQNDKLKNLEIMVGKKEFDRAASTLNDVLEISPNEIRLIN